MNRYISTAFKTGLTGVGQVMFMKSPWAGLLFLTGIFWGAYECDMPQVAWGALAGGIASYVAGVLAGVRKVDGYDGLWGFNGVLVGCAFPTFIADTYLMWTALILCAMITTWCKYGFDKALAPLHIGSLTFPFVFMTWIFLLAAQGMSSFSLSVASAPPLDWPFTDGFLALFGPWLRGISQVFLINSWVTGILFLIGLAICSTRAAVWAAVSSAIALVVAILSGADPDAVQQGLFGFSPVLTGIALGAVFIKPSFAGVVWTFIAVVTSVFMQAAFNAFLSPLAIPSLTAPFCFATWLFLLPASQFPRLKEYVN